ncbi:hypothetical protein ACJZ2D_001742 [Fusarium nematophilum]
MLGARGSPIGGQKTKTPYSTKKRSSKARILAEISIKAQHPCSTPTPFGTVKVGSAPRWNRRWFADAEDHYSSTCFCPTPSLGSVKDWHRIAAKLPNRTNKDCRKRWVNKVRGGLRSGPWSEAEDQKLREAVEKYGQRWTVISQEFGSRSSDREYVVEWYWNQPAADDWSRNRVRQTMAVYPRSQARASGMDFWRAQSRVQDYLLLELVQKFGHDWRLICCRHYPTRSRNDVKNRFTILSRRLVPGTAGEPTPQASPAPDSPPDAISAFLVEDNEGTHGVGQDFQDNEYLGGLGPLGAPNPNPLDGGEPGLPYQSSAGLAITFAEELGFNLPASPRREDITTTGSMEPLLFGSSGAYQSTSTSAGDPVDTGEPDWSCLYMVNNTDDVPTFSPDVEAPGYGSHGQTVADSFIPDLDTQTGLHPSQAPPNILESPAGAFNKCVKKLQEDPSPAGDGDSDLQSPSFKVVLTAEKCSHELVKYLIDVTKAIQGRVKMEVVI